MAQDGEIIELVQPEQHAELQIEWHRRGTRLNYTLTCEGEATEPEWLVHQLRQICDEIAVHGFDWERGEKSKSADPRELCLELASIVEGRLGPGVALEDTKTVHEMTDAELHTDFLRLWQELARLVEGDDAPRSYVLLGALVAMWGEHTKRYEHIKQAMLHDSSPTGESH